MDKSQNQRHGCNQSFKYEQDIYRLLDDSETLGMTFYEQTGHAKVGRPVT